MTEPSKQEIKAAKNVLKILDDLWESLRDISGELEKLAANFHTEYEREGVDLDNL